MQCATCGSKSDLRLETDGSIVCRRCGSRTEGPAWAPSMPRTCRICSRIHYSAPIVGEAVICGVCGAVFASAPRLEVHAGVKSSSSPEKLIVTFPGLCGWRLALERDRLSATRWARSQAIGVGGSQDLHVMWGRTGLGHGWEIAHWCDGVPTGGTLQTSLEAVRIMNVWLAEIRRH